MKVSKDKVIVRGEPLALFEYSDNCWGIFHSHTDLHDVIPSEEDKNSAMFKHYKFVMGNKNTFYTYWIDSLNYLRYKPFIKEDLQ